MNRLRRRRLDDEGFALLTVIGSMTVLTLFLLASLAFVLSNMKPNRQDQDAKAALAAAQAGIDEYVARLNANDAYWSSTDCSNLALTPREPATCPGARPADGIPVPGTTGGATFRYRLLTKNADTTKDGIIQLAVTGTSRDRRRELIAELRPAGFLQYIYFTDKEVTDPALDAPNPRATRNGQDYYYDASTRKYYVWSADRAIADVQCARYWYTGRSAPSYTSGPYIEEKGRIENGTFIVETTTTRQASATERIAFSCQEIRFAGGDKISGKLKTNDAVLLDGAPWFTSPVTESAWSNPPDPARLWRGSGVPSPGTPTERGYKPVYAAPLGMPDSNAELKVAAATAGVGCLYSGETKLTLLASGQLRVLSPGTAVTTACGGGSVPRDIPVPAVVYVQDLPSTQTCTQQLGFPGSGEDTSERLTTDYSCRKGNAYLSGTIKGRMTIGTSNDVVVVGDTTYEGGMSGTDTLGLIPQNYVWIYHPVTTDGRNLLSTPVRKLDAAILSVNHSFLVQNYGVGAALSAETQQDTKLRVRGAIAQRYRGPVGSGNADDRHGYLKDYQYDPRLNNAPPPYFLRPVTSPYSVVAVTD